MTYPIEQGCEGIVVAKEFEAGVANGDAKAGETANSFGNFNLLKNLSAVS